MDPSFSKFPLDLYRKKHHKHYEVQSDFCISPYILTFMTLMKTGQKKYN